MFNVLFSILFLVLAFYKSSLLIFCYKINIMMSLHFKHSFFNVF